MPVGEKQKQPLHFHAAAGGEEFLNTLWAEVGEPLHQLVGLLEAFVLREPVEKLKHGELRRGKSQGPVPLAPWLNKKGALAEVRMPAVSAVRSRNQILAGPWELFGREEFFAVVVENRTPVRRWSSQTGGRSGP